MTSAVGHMTVSVGPAVSDRLCLGGCEVSLAEWTGAEDAPYPRERELTLVARTVTPLVYPPPTDLEPPRVIYHDLAGAELPGRISIDWEHDPQRIVGWGRPRLLDGPILAVTGQAVVVHEDSPAAELMAFYDHGVPFEASIVWDPPASLFEEVLAGETAVVNGQRVAGPCWIVRRWRLRNASICLLGQDHATGAYFLSRAAATARPRALPSGVPSAMSSVPEPVAPEPVAPEPAAPAPAPPPEPSPAPAPEAPAPEAPAPQAPAPEAPPAPTAPPAPEPAAPPAPQPAAPQPTAPAPTPPPSGDDTEVDPTPEPIRVAPVAVPDALAVVDQFTTAFGAEHGLAYLKRRLPYQLALEADHRRLREANDQLAAQVADLNSRLAQTAVGHRAPPAFGSGESSEQSSGAANLTPYERAVRATKMPARN